MGNIVGSIVVVFGVIMLVMMVRDVIKITKEVFNK